MVVTAPSGAGKTTLVKHLLGIGSLNLAFSVSACTRPMRDGEVNGKDYYFMSVDEFRDKIEEGEFVEWEEVYKNRFYGTLKSEMDRLWMNGHNILFDVDVKGGLSLKQKFTDQAFVLFIQPPSLEVLRQRLEERGTDTPEEIEGRINKAALEIKFAGKFDHIIVNDNLDYTFSQAEALVRAFLEGS